ncbi:MAG: SDR family oxidoreductase [Rhodospirillales bacterium]|nr:SDR family oxidoreductase [Rhodospirillales bacterium]
MPTVLITGANRGLGLEFAKQYAADGWSVIATCRNPVGVGELGTIEGDIAVYGLDVLDQNSIDRFVNDLDGRPIDILINNAGVYGPKPVKAADVTMKDWTPVFQTNAMAPLFIARALLPNVEKGDRKLIVNISSIMASIEQGSAPSEYIYRSSKTALNMVMACYAQEIADTGVAVTMFHPGWVQTDMGGPSATLTPTESITHLRASIEKLGFKDTGKFYNYDGSPLPW